jgi:hypothetical protein
VRPTGVAAISGRLDRIARERDALDEEMAANYREYEQLRDRRGILEAEQHDLIVRLQQIARVPPSASACSRSRTPGCLVKEGRWLASTV